MTLVDESGKDKRKRLPGKEIERFAEIMADVAISAYTGNDAAFENEESARQRVKQDCIFILFNLGFQTTRKDEEAK